jgi:hypothetical protein
LRAEMGALESQEDSRMGALERDLVVQGASSS